MKKRVTDSQVNKALADYTSALSAAYRGTGEVKVTLHLGDTTAKIDNVLLVKVPDSWGTTNVWIGGTAGRTKREAFNALCLMAVALYQATEAEEHRERESYTCERCKVGDHNYTDEGGEPRTTCRCCNNPRPQH